MLMPIKTNTDLNTLDYVSFGSPIVKGSAKNITDILDTAYFGSNFTAIQPFGNLSAASGTIDQASATTTFVNVNGTWQEIFKYQGSIFVNENGTWKSSDTIGGRVGQYWKTNDR